MYRQDPRHYESALLIYSLLKDYISRLQMRPALFNPMVNMWNFFFVLFAYGSAENLCRSSLHTFARYNRCVLHVKCALAVLFPLLCFLSLASKSYFCIVGTSRKG